MIVRGISCIAWALAAGSASAFAPTGPAVAVRQSWALESTAAVAPSSSPSVLLDYDYHASDRLPYSPTGYETWRWNTRHSPENQQRGGESDGEGATTTHSINYLELGDPSKPALLLVHGFGASAYHWRHNIPVLARDYHVYALDLLGFGWSDKPIMDYDASVWRDQVVDFVREVIFSADDENEAGSKRTVAIAGNSLGGYTAMYASSDERIRDRVHACLLLNSAGRFRDPEASDDDKKEPNPIIQSISAAIQRFVIACSFVYTKQPMRIEQILKQVYPIDPSNVDAELVESIQTPSLDDSAAEVFYRVITKNGRGPQAYVDDILKELECPVALVWGESDPWIKPAAADKMQKIHAAHHGENVGGENGSRRIERMSIDAGHCPHDEAPAAVNAAILQFVGACLN